MNLTLYIITLLLLGLSYFKDRDKTKKALKKGLEAFKNILPQFLGIIVLTGILLANFNQETISKIIGDQSGWLGVLISGMVGAVTLIPGFVAFPTAAMLLRNGAGYVQITAFISTLMMVGIVTIPVEIRYFGRRLAVLRNSIAFIFSFIVAYVIGMLVM